LGEILPEQVEPREPKVPTIPRVVRTVCNFWQERRSKIEGQDIHGVHIMRVIDRYAREVGLWDKNVVPSM